MPTIEGGFTTKEKDAEEITDELNNAGVETKAPFTAKNPEFTNPNAKKVKKFANETKFKFNQMKHGYTKEELDNKFTKEQLKRWAKIIYDIKLNTNNLKSEMLDNFINARKNL